MASHVILKRAAAVSSGLWAAIAAAWPTDEYNGDSGVFVQGAVGAGNSATFLELDGNLLDDGAIPLTALVGAIVFSANYTITAPAGNTGFFTFGSASATYSGNASGSLTATVDLTGSGLTWADLLADGPFFSWIFSRDGAAQAGGNLRIVVSGFAATVNYTLATPLSVDTCAPDTGDTAGGTSVTLTGTGFSAATGVSFGSTPAASWAMVDDTTITAVSPTHAAGAVAVTVTGVGTLADAFTYTYTITADATAVAPTNRLPPVPGHVPVTAGDKGPMAADWLGWFRVVKQRIEGLLPASGFSVDLEMQGSPVVDWDSVLKDGSSLADLTTRNAGDLSSGTLPAARMPALTGDVTSPAGSVATTLATVNANVGTFGSASKTVTLTANAKGLITAIAQQDIASAGLTKTDDTNVTLTLTGTIASALLKAVNLALGWTGFLAPARGGVGADVSGVAKGGLIVGTAAGAFGLKAVGTDGQVLTAAAASAGGVSWATPSVGTTINASIYRATNQTLTHNTEAALSLSTADFDTSSIWSGGSPTRLTVPTGGTGAYLVRGTVKFGTGVQGTLALRIYKNGVLLTEETSLGLDLASGSEYHQVSTLVSLVPTDYIEVKVLALLAAGAGTVDAVGGTGNTFVQIARMSPQTGAATSPHALLDGSQNNDTTAAAPAKGALITSDGATWLRQAVGSNAQVLTADSTQANGLKWAAPAASGALVLLEQHTAAATATLDFTSFSSLYDEYVFEIVNLVNATNNVDLKFRVSKDGGATYETTLYEYVTFTNSTSNAGIGSNTSTAADGILMFPGIDNSQSYGVSGRLTLYDPLSATLKKTCLYDISAPLQSVARRYMLRASGFWGAINAVNAVRFLYSSGSVTSGTVRMYGVAK